MHQHIRKVDIFVKKRNWKIYLVILSNMRRKIMKGKFEGNL
jgi:hypothetical protein